MFQLFFRYRVCFGARGMSTVCRAVRDGCLGNGTWKVEGGVVKMDKKGDVI